MTTFISTSGNDIFPGTNGVEDLVSYAASAAGVDVSLLITDPQNTRHGIDTLTSIEGLIGSSADDRLSGNNDNNTIDGGAGLGTDTLNGGLGIDTVSYGSSNAGVTVSLSIQGLQNTGGAGFDQLSGFENLKGSAFNDTLSGNSGDNVLDGQAGVDTASYANAGSGVRVSLGSATAQNTFGAGIDTLRNFENLRGSSFGDTLSGDAGNNVLDGSDGIDTVSYTNASAGVQVSLGLSTQNTGGAGMDTLQNFENLTGSLFADTLRGNFANNLINGNGGIDTVSYDNAVAAVQVSLSSTTAQNTGGAGTDTLVNVENLTGSSHNDTLQGNVGNNVLDGGSGIDTVSYSSAGAGVRVSLDTATPQVTQGAGVDTLRNFENLTGSSFGDYLRGNSGDNVLNGNGGSDWVSYDNASAGVRVSLGTTIAQNTLGAGNDTLLNMENIQGSLFNDNLQGSAGSNILSGNSGIDTLSYLNATGGVTVSLAITTAQDTGGAGLDTLSGFEILVGSNGADRLSGDGGNNTLSGGLGSDTLVAGGGIDILTGGDILRTVSTLIDGPSFLPFNPPSGSIGLFPGSNIDRFVFNSVSDSPNAAPDRITDFAPSIGEKIDVSAIDANTLLSGNQAFNWIGAIVPNQPRLNQGELGYQVSGADILLIGNTSSSNGNPDFRVQLSALGASGGLISSDFIL
jgi:Ca2+-binding RTX toxin-like protein